MKNATLWADVAHPINVGGHGDPNGMDTVQNITFRNIDILDQAEKQIDYQGCLAINPGRCVKMHTFCFLRTKPRLSQAGALLLPKDFVSLGIRISL